MNKDDLPITPMSQPSWTEISAIFDPEASKFAQKQAYQSLLRLYKKRLKDIKDPANRKMFDEGIELCKSMIRK